MNPYWKERDELPSGTTRADHNATLLEYLWIPDSHRRAVASVLKYNFVYYVVYYVYMYHITTSYLTSIYIGLVPAQVERP
jgi:hypothetical protein